MFRKLGFLVVLGLSLPAWSAAEPGVIAGYVRSSSGVPQMGAAVQILGAAADPLKVFTDERGFYSIHDVLPGVYSLKVSAPAFLPALREKIGVRPGAKLMVNVTLTTLFEAIQLGPLRGPADDDNWKWTLRSVSNRPILRALDDGTTAVVLDPEQSSDHLLKGSLIFMAGSASQGFGSASDMSTGFSVEHSMLSAGTLSLNGNIGYGGGVPAAVLRTSYTSRLNNGFEPTMAFTVRRFSSPGVNSLPGGAALQALSLSTADRMTLGNVLELRFGSELQTIQFMGRVNAFRPFGSADLHLTRNTVVEYQYASSVPNTRNEKGFDSAPSDLSETDPRVSMTSYSPAVERGYHQEVSVSQRIGKNNVQVALYSDRVADPVLTGVGETAVSGDVLPDVASGTFSYQGNDLETRGVRVVLQRKLLSDLTATLDYAYGGVLDLARPDVELQDAREWIHTQRRQAMAAKFSGTVPCLKTRWIASYRWTSGPALTPVDLFNTSAGQSDPYLNLFLRQPIPASFLSGHMEILVDVRNLLAEGYVPVVGSDGQTVYLVQSARSIRGGVMFSF